MSERCEWTSEWPSTQRVEFIVILPNVDRVLFSPCPCSCGFFLGADRSMLLLELLDEEILGENSRKTTSSDLSGLPSATDLAEEDWRGAEARHFADSTSASRDSAMKSFSYAETRSKFD